MQRRKDIYSLDEASFNEDLSTRYIMAGSLNEDMSQDLYKYLKNRTISQKLELDEGCSEAAKSATGADDKTTASDNSKDTSTHSLDNIQYEDIRVTPEDVKYLANQMCLSHQYVRTQMNYALKARLAGYSAESAFQRKPASKGGSRSENSNKVEKTDSSENIQISFNLKGVGPKQFVIRNES